MQENGHLVRADQLIEHEGADIEQQRATAAWLGAHLVDLQACWTGRLASVGPTGTCHSRLLQSQPL